MMMIMLLKAFPNLMPWCELARRHTIPVVRPANALERYPHEFSGGQRQRIGIARALSVELELIVADEPVSALDVLVQPQVLLLRELRERRGLAFLFVSHDLSVVRWFCGSVAVMYLGRIVEHGPVAEVLRAPLHPYANMLREASPEPDPARHPPPHPDDLSGPIRVAQSAPDGANHPYRAVEGARHRRQGATAGDRRGDRRAGGSAA
jgi:peptide/nickel transport system ATP-binding protein